MERMPPTAHCRHCRNRPCQYSAESCNLCLSTGYDQLQNAAEQLVELQSYSQALDQTVLLRFNVSAPSETNFSHFFCSRTDKFYFKGPVEQVTSIFHAAFGINPSAESQDPPPMFPSPLKVSQLLSFQDGSKKNR